MESKMWILSPSSNKERCLDFARHDKDREREFLSADLCENCAQFVEIYRFDQMKVESCVFAAPNVFVGAKSGDRNRLHRMLSLCLGNHLVTASVGKTNVAQDDIEFLRLDGFQSALRIIGD